MNISKNSQDCTFDSIDLSDEIIIVDTIDDEVIEEMLCNTAY